MMFRTLPAARLLVVMDVLGNLVNNGKLGRKSADFTDAHVSKTPGSVEYQQIAKSD